MEEEVPRLTYNYLQHLEECHLCFTSEARPNQYMTIVIMGTGKTNAENEGLWYKKCLSNPGICNGFKWALSIARGPRSREDSAIVCPGRLCLTRPLPRAGSNSCHIGLCQNCCVLAHQETPTIPVCPCTTHLRALRKEAGSSPAVPVASSSGLPRPKSFATPLSDTYQARLRDLENENHQRISSVADERSYIRKASKVVTFQWWSVDGGEPDTMDVPAPSHPWFHPVHSPDMIALYGVDKKMFSYFDPAHNVWKITSSNTGPQFVQKDVVLQFRSLGVKTGVGMPLGSALRLDQNNRVERQVPALPTLAGELTPNRDGVRSSSSDAQIPLRPFIPQLNFGTTSFEGSIFSSPASVSSSQGSPLSHSVPFDSPSPMRPTPSLLHRQQSQSGIPANLAVGLSLDTTSTSLPSPQSQPSSDALSVSNPSDSQLREITSNATRGTSETGWPYKFTRDMAAGFILLDQCGGTPRSRPTDFPRVSGCDYKSQTYSDNRKVWDKACNSGLDPLTLIANTNKATWRDFRQQWK
ncbi:hypothetical protein B0H11DRAFT_362761 [Mycena galericulata]|nr:hypothetical protein B0H11DRAFT_362761 [Mycena galericulata]